MGSVWLNMCICVAERRWMCAFVYALERERHWINMRVVYAHLYNVSGPSRQVEVKAKAKAKIECSKHLFTEMVSGVCILPIFGYK